MPWYQVAAVILAGSVSLIVVGRAAVEGFTRAVASVMAHEIRELHRAFDELDRQNAARFASVDNALGDIQAQFHPNGGSSHADRLAQLAAQVTQVAAKLDRMSGA
jgi:outer membrane murein-binding lipoprotein Lpp